MGRALLFSLVLVALLVAGAAWAWTHPTEPDFSHARCPQEKPSAPRPALWPSSERFGGGQLVQPLPFTAPPEESSLYAALRQHDVPYETFERAAAVASGLVTREQQQRFHHLAERAFRRMEPDLIGPTPTQKAAQLLVALHKHVFTRADEKQAYPSITLERGAFNCVSATVLYNLFATRLGLKTLAMAEPDHVYSLVELQGRYIEVATTASFGFGRQLPAHETVGAAGSIPTDSKTAVQNNVLLSYVLEDRLAFKHDDVLQGQDEKDPQWLATSAAIYRRIADFSPHDERAARNVIASLRNLGIVLGHQHRLDESFEATRLAVEASIGHPMDAVDARNDLAVATIAAMEEHIGHGDFEGAAWLLTEARRSARCGEPGMDCTALEGDARNLLLEYFEHTPSWPLAQVALTMGTWRELDDDFIVTSVCTEADRLWSAGSPECAEQFVQQVGALKHCDRESHGLCRSMARWAAQKWLPRDPTRAAWWAHGAW